MLHCNITRQGRRSCEFFVSQASRHGLRHRRGSPCSGHEQKSAQLRIVAGELRGRVIQAPEGEATRPTSDRARQAVFNILEHAPWSPGLDGLRVLDLFAGSGAMGLEALSRGAVHAAFVETAGPALAALRANIETFRLGPRTAVLRQDATRLAARGAEPAFDLAVLDPPYGQGLGEPALAALTTGGWLAPEAVVVFERATDEPALELPGWEVLDQRRYGKAAVWLLRLA